MNHLVEFAIFAIIALVIAAGAGLSYLANERRKKALAKLAEELGLEYSQNLTSTDSSRFFQFEVTTEGRQHRASGAFVAETETMRMVVFDYQYVVGSGKSQKTVNNAAVLVNHNGLVAPEMKLEPKSWTESISKFFGSHSISFDDDSEFTNNYRIQGSDEPSIRKFLSKERRSKILDAKIARFYTRGDSFAILYPRKVLTAANIRSMMDDGLRLASALA